MLWLLLIHIPTAFRKKTTTTASNPKILDHGNRGKGSVGKAVWVQPWGEGKQYETQKRIRICTEVDWK